MRRLLQPLNSSPLALRGKAEEDSQGAPGLPGPRTRAKAGSVQGEGERGEWLLGGGEPSKPREQLGTEAVSWSRGLIFRAAH